MSSRRPNPWQWIRYAYGGRLPQGLSPWVLKDTTRATWVVRHVLRSLAQMAPLMVAVLVFVPGEFWIRGCMVIGGTFVGVAYMLAYVTEMSEHRLQKAGFPPGTGEAERAQRTAAAQAVADRRHAERVASRLARHRPR